MASNLFNALNMSQLQALKNNPVQFLLQRRLNLPQNFSGGPQEIVQHLLNTGQMSQEQLHRLQEYINQIQPRM